MKKSSTIFIVLTAVFVSTAFLLEGVVGIASSAAALICAVLALVFSGKSKKKGR